MTTPLAEAKAALRETVRARLQAIAPEQRAADSVRLCARLQSAELWSAAQAILFFAPLPDEPDVWPLLEFALRENRLVALPAYDAARQEYLARRVRDLAADVRPGRYGVPEPGTDCPVVPLNQLDLVLVPGVAFDLNGGRLGRGKGFYDRLLSSVRGATCGVAYDEQLVASVPVEPHDIRLNHILTPTRWHTARPARF